MRERRLCSMWDEGIWKENEGNREGRTEGNEVE